MTPDRVASDLWSSRAIEVLVRRAGEMIAERTLSQPFARVGHQAGCELFLPELERAGCQLYIHATDEGIYCLGLSSGTPNGWIGEKSYAPLGDYRIYARFADGGPPPVVSSDDLRKRTAAGEGWPRLVVRSSHGKTVKHRLPARLTLAGRNQRCTLRFDDEAVSDAHAVMFWDGREMWIVDLLGSGGTLFDGHRIVAKRLPAGHELLIGNNRVQWRLNLESPEALADVRARLTESERERFELMRALEERQTEIERLNAALSTANTHVMAAGLEEAEQEKHVATEATMPEPFEQLQVAPASDARQSAIERDEKKAPSGAAGQGLFGEELVDRLLDFKSKREAGRIRRRLMWTAAAALVLLALGALATVVARPWLAEPQWPESNAALPSLR